jgi:hypothetical protein
MEKTNLNQAKKLFMKIDKDKDSAFLNKQSVQFSTLTENQQKQQDKIKKQMHQLMLAYDEGNLQNYLAH